MPELSGQSLQGHFYKLRLVWDTAHSSLSTEKLPSLRFVFLLMPGPLAALAFPRLLFADFRPAPKAPLGHRAGVHGVDLRLPAARHQFEDYGSALRFSIPPRRQARGCRREQEAFIVFFDALVG